MRHLYLGLMVFALAASQQVFANHAMDDNKSCAMIAKQCKAAGFVREESDTKGFWHNCMGPVLLGQTVDGVKVDADAVKDCRKFKIDELEKDLDKLKDAK